MRNIYKSEKDDYDKLLTENLTKTHKKSSRPKVNKINYNAKRIAEDLSLVFDIESFYTSFSEELFKEALNFAKSKISPVKKCYLLCDLVAPYYLIKPNLG